MNRIDEAKFDDARAEIARLRKAHPPCTRRWTHKKTHGQYWIMGYAIDERGLYPVVIYISADEGNAPQWCRPASEFFDGRFE